MGKRGIKLLKLIIREELSKLGVKNKSISVVPDDEIADVIEPDLIDILNKSYSKIGGHHKINGPGSIKKSYDTWMVADVDKDPEPDVAVFGSKRGKNVKLGALATDGGPGAVTYLGKMLKDEVLKNGWWGEVSGSLAMLAFNQLKLEPIEDERLVKHLLSGKDIEWLGEHPDGKFPNTKGWYRRLIDGQPHVKIIVGDV